MVLILVHVIAFRRFGVVGPWNEIKRRSIGFFWPDQVYKDTVVFALIFLVLIGLSVYSPPPIAGPADPLDTFYIPKPEWNFLFLYQALKLFPGRLEPVGTAGVPLFLILVLVLLPFLDRNPERSPARRPYAMMGGAALVLAVIILAFLGYYSKPGVAEAPSTPIPSPPSAPMQPAPTSVKEGARLFQSQGCIGCHRIYGTGGTVGPALSFGRLQGRTREWLIIQIRNPKAHNPTTIMPDYSWPSEYQVNSVVDYLLRIAAGTAPPVIAPLQVPVGAPSTKPVRLPVGPPGPAAYIIGSPERGIVWYTQVCLFCHGPEGTGNIPNPGSEDGKIPALNPINMNLSSRDPLAFAVKIDRFLQHGSVPQGPNPKFQMPAFGDNRELSQQAVANLEAYILQLNGVDRAQLLHPGLEARYYFWMAAAIFGLAFMGLWIWKEKGKKWP
jgi:mono/diheme cytochrome c family protein